LPDLTTDTARAWAEHMRRARQPGDRVVASIHWGGNWGFDVPASHVAFAHALVDDGVDLVHGHSSHHPRPIEVYRQKLILYGCGDLLNDYEGIGGYEEYRGELSLIYLAGLDERSGHLQRLRLVPQRIRAMRLEHAAPDDTAWLRRTIDRVSGPFGVRIAAQGQDLVAMPAAIGS
jgi:poly-gamma-glutamate synthesis protein (capsule biosynthesis protein)